MKNNAQEYFDNEKHRIVETWKNLIRFKSISPDSSYVKECRACAEWLSLYLENLGFSITLHETAGNPVIVAERKVREGAKSVVVYNHYDVQPAAAGEEGWSSDPFEPVMKDDRLYGRGAADNKGQLMYVIAAVEYLLSNNLLEVNLTLLIEGDEERGSAAFLAILPQLQAQLTSDVFIVADLGCLTLDHPVVTCGVRGHTSAEVTLEGASRDLHSGTHGGFAPNPALILAKMLSCINDEHGMPAHPALLVGLDKIDAATRDAIKKVPFDSAWYENKVGVKSLNPPPGLTEWERIALYPNFELKGFNSGYTGPGSRNIIPGKAIAKIGMRVGPSQDAEAVLQGLEDYFHAQETFGCKLTFTKNDSAPGGFVSPAIPAVKAAKEVLDELSGGKAGFHWEGATIPLVGPLQLAGGTDPVMIGFFLEQDSIHAPDESFGMPQLQYGFHFMVKYLQRIANGF